MKEIFALIIMIWGTIGFMGIVYNGGYNRRINWYMITCLLTLPFLPLLAYICNLI